jgi:D-serine deaminase-like pyridoxal phosphate-dependent protein
VTDDATPPHDDPPVPPAPVAAGTARDAALGAVGRPGSRRLVATPALVCDVDLLEANIARMAARAAEAGVALRPHAKTHKSAFVAALQLDAGAAGIACAKVGEAEVLVAALEAAGHGDVSVLVTSPVAGAAVAGRVAALAAACDLMVVVDHPDGVDELAAAVAAGTGTGQLAVVCDVDVGLGRTGVTGPDPALAVVRRIAGSPGLRFAGVQGYGGHLQHLPGRAERATATRTAAGRLRSVVDALEADGHEVALRTGGGTGTAGIDMEDRVLDELQPGSYVFMDQEYRDALGDDPEGRFAQSLFVATTVVSANQDGFVTVDAGLKAMATDAGPPTVVGHAIDVHYHFFGDEHGLVTQAPPTRFARGDRLDLVPPHCDPTVDRYDELWLARGDTLVGVTPIDARGCSR